MVAKVVATHTFSKREIRAAKSSRPLPLNKDRQQPRLYEGYPLRKDQGGYFILTPSKNPPTMIRKDIPRSVGLALELIRDDALSPDQIYKQD
jgi:hypothetical protein